MTPRARKRSPERSPRRRFAKATLDRLVEEAVVDAYGQAEPRVGLLSMIQTNLVCPFTTEVFGASVRVERVDLNDADEIVAVCRRSRERRMM